VDSYGLLHRREDKITTSNWPKEFQVLHVSHCLISMELQGRHFRFTSVSPYLISALLLSDRFGKIYSKHKKCSDQNHCLVVMYKKKAIKVSLEFKERKDSVRSNE